MVEGGVECAASALGRRQLSHEVDVDAGDQHCDRFFCCIRNATEFWSGDQIEQCLFDGGHPALSEFGAMALQVEAGYVPAHEVDVGFSVSELERASVMFDSHHGDTQNTGNGGVDPRGADAHQSHPVSVTACGGDGQGGGFQGRQPRSSDGIVGNRGVEAGSKPMEDAAALQPRKLRPRVRIYIGGVERDAIPCRGAGASVGHALAPDSASLSPP